MKSRKSLTIAVFTVVVLAFMETIVSAQTPSKFANVRTLGTSVGFEPAISYASATLTVSRPDGTVFRREFPAGAAISFPLFSGDGLVSANGQYTYEITFAPILESGVREALAAARAKGDDAAVVQRLRESGQLPAQPQIQSGSFSVQNGIINIGTEIETPVYKSSKVTTQSTGIQPLDQVIADDLIVQGSACVGVDCVNNENFGFDTIRLKENNTRIQFDDTSGADFPTNNWQIRANSSASGGTSFLAFVDQGASGNSETGTIVFEVDAGAPANALKVSSTGKVGLRTATPVLDLHMNTSDTPAVRFEQNNSGGFGPQTWDIGANEANFFVRDVTGGSRLSFRIRPGAPTSSVDISGSGKVGLGNSNPLKRLHVGAGSDSPITTVDGIYLSNAGDTGFAIRDSTNDIEFQFAIANVLVPGVLMGTVTNHPLILRTNVTERMRILANGRVGIGTVAPDQLLSVNGDASKVGGGSWQTFSDERLKNIIGKYSRGLSAIMRLQPLFYEYKSDNALGLKSEGQHVGFGAQSLRQVIPEAVTKTSDGYLMVNNDPILWTMLNAIKEQQKEIEDLKAQVAKLKASPRRHRR